MIERSQVLFQLPPNFFQESLSLELVSVSLHSEGDYRENLNEMSYAALKDLFGIVSKTCPSDREE